MFTDSGIGNMTSSSQDGPPPTLKGTGKTKHVFICFSSKDADFARKYVIDPLQRKGIVTCNYEDDFIPSLTVFENITTAIRESRKYVLIISKDFNESNWCDYESQLTLSLSIDMRASNLIIPLVKDDAQVPEFLNLFSQLDISEDNDAWFEKLYKAVISPIEERHMKTPLQSEDIHFRFISIAHFGIQNDKDAMQKLKRVQNTVNHRDDSLDLRLQAKENDTCDTLVNGSYHQFHTSAVVEKILKMITHDTKIFIWLSQDFEKVKICQNLRRMVCLLTADMDRKKAPLLIPVHLDGEIPDDLDFACLFTRNGIWYEKLMDLLYREGK